MKMEKKLCSSELFCLAAILFYGNFTQYKSPLTQGTAAIPTYLLSCAVEITAVFVLLRLPHVGGIWRILLAVFIIPFTVDCILDAASLIHETDFSYVSSAVISASSGAIVFFLAKKGLGVIGRVATVAAVSTGLFLCLLLAFFCKDFNFTRLLAGDFKTDGFADGAAAPIAQVAAIYLMRPYFYKAVPGRSAKPPKEQALTEENRRKSFGAVIFSAWLLSFVVGLGVTVFCLALAPSPVYAAVPFPSVFAARLFSASDITPIVSVWIFLLVCIRCGALFSVSFSAITDEVRERLAKARRE